MERRVQKTVIAAQAQELGLGVQDIADDSIARAELGLPLTNEPALTMDVNPFLSHNFSKKGSLNRHTDDNDGTVAQRSRDIKFSKVHKSAKGQLGANAIQPSLVTNKYSVGLNASYIKKYWDEFEEIVFEPAYCYQHPHGFVFQQLSCKYPATIRFLLSLLLLYFGCERNSPINHIRVCDFYSRKQSEPMASRSLTQPQNSSVDPQEVLVPKCLTSMALCLLLLSLRTPRTFHYLCRVSP
jgi:hypothetical protein